MKEGPKSPESGPPQASLKDAYDKTRSFLSQVLEEKAKKEQESPLKPGETFTPEDEIKKIKELPKEGRPAKLREIKEKLAYQKKGLAKIQEELIKTIRANPNATYAQLFDQATEAGAQYGLDWWQEEITRRLIKRYIEKHEAVQKARKEYPKDNDLFEAVFGRQPKGRIEVITGPITLYFKTRDEKDYALIYSQSFLEKREPTLEEITEALKTGGALIFTSLVPGLEGNITAENSTIETFGYSESLHTHEEQHAITNLFKEERERLAAGHSLNEARNAILAGGIKNLEENLRRYFIYGRRANVEDATRDELLSYSKQGVSTQEIVKNLIEKDGLYDNLSKSEGILSAPIITELGKDHKPLIEKIVTEVFDRKKYAQSIKDAIAVLSGLRKKGYTLEQTIALLQPEPLFKWKKTYKRLTGESIQNEK